MGVLDFFRKQGAEKTPAALQLQEEASLAKAIITELNAKLKVAGADLEKTKELAAKDKTAAKTAELALKEAVQQLDSQKKIEIENKSSLDLKSKEVDALNKKVLELQTQLSDKTESTSKLQAMANKADSNLAVATNQFKAIQVQHDAAVKEKNSLQSQIDILNKEPIELKNTIEAQKAEIAKLKAELEKTVKQSLQNKSKQDDVDQENKLLLMQNLVLQDEIDFFHTEKQNIEKNYKRMQARFERVAERYPEFVDFSKVELIAFDHSSGVPSLTWRVSDYAYSGQALTELLFQIALQNENPGIGLVTEANAVAQEDSILVPKLLAQRSQQVDYFLAMSATEQRQLSAALSILAQLEANQWRGLEVPQELDLSFWKPFITQLIAQWKVLPASLRFDQVKLKRELINTDYEHLWLELHGASYGKQSWKKLEVRLGAALVQPDGFSQFPKLEIPLIDGKLKPFESWYAESYDDSGAKFELRFSLEQDAFDRTALTKLSELDQSLVLRLIYGMPVALQKLQQQGVTIHRDWKIWQGFALQAKQVLERSRKAANANPKLDNSTVNEIKSERIQDLVVDKKNSTDLKGDTSKALVNGAPNQPMIIRVSKEAAHKIHSPAKKTPTLPPISTKTKKSNKTAVDRSPELKKPNNKNRTSTASKTQRRAA